MGDVRWLRRGAAAACLLTAATAAAQPGDAEAVAQARRDYAQAMQGHDIGLQNAMRAELDAQLAMAARARRAALSHRNASGAPATGGPRASRRASPLPDAGKSE